MSTHAPTPPITRSNLNGRTLGRYEVLTTLASGGMATVYVGRAKGLAGFERLVAIKVLHPHIAHDEGFISMFLDEARLAAQIRHPNVVATLDISDTEGDGFFLVMEYVEGDHLAAIVRRAAKAGTRLSPAAVSRLLLDALGGLQAAHELRDTDGNLLNLVHRDLSPHNVLVGSDGVARIVDFGVAKAQVRLSTTDDGYFKGKVSYAAPEQASEGRTDQRSDIFSLGIVLWEALVGRRLFRAETNAKTLNNVMNPQVPPPSSVDPALAPFDEVAAKALAKEAEDRYQSAEEFSEALERAAENGGGIATPRAVAKEIEAYLAEKLSSEREAVKSALDGFGRSEITGARPTPSSDEHSLSDVRPVATPDDATIGAKPSTVTAASRKPSRRVGLWAALALILGFAFAAAWLLDRQQFTPEKEALAKRMRPAPFAGAEEELATTEEGASNAETTSEVTSEAISNAEDADQGVEAPVDTIPTRTRTRRGSRRTSGDDNELFHNPYRP